MKLAIRSTVAACAVAIGVFGSAPVFAAETKLKAADVFARHFTVQKDKDGNATYIVLNHKLAGFSIHPLMDEIKRDVRALRMQMRGSQKNAVATLGETFGSEEFATWPEAAQSGAIQGLEALRDFDADSALETPEFAAFADSWSEKLKAHLIGFAVVAAPGDKAFFHTRAVGLQTLDFATIIAQIKFRDPKMLKIAKYIFDRAIGMLDERRSFYQNMLFHYLEQYDSTELGLSAKDTAQIYSSIYESKIGWIQVFEARNARKNWERYGEAKFRMVRNIANQRLAMNKQAYTSIGERPNFGFVEVKETEARKIVNLVNPRYLFSQKPADAYIFENPWKIEHQRRLIRLAQLGLQFVGVPDLLKSIGQSFMASMYVQQSLTEGALAAHFELVENVKDLEVILRQSINPFVRTDFNVALD